MNNLKFYRIIVKAGKVYLFQLEDPGQPSRQYETFAKYAQLCYQGYENRLAEADFYSDYYSKILELYVTADAITPKRKELKFQDIADMYHIINSNTTSLFIYQYNDESQRLYNEIKDKKYLNRQDYQKVTQYSSQVREYEKDKFPETSNGVKIWFGPYSEEIGLSNEDEIYYI